MLSIASLVATSDNSDSCGAFLRTLPTDGFTIHSNLYRVAICHYLGLPVFHLLINDRDYLKYRGASFLDNHGIHALACQIGWPSDYPPQCYSNFTLRLEILVSR